jgi:hypothetical protein
VVKIDDKSECKVISSGVRQVCGLSPIHFVRYMNAIVKEWRQKLHAYIPIDSDLQLDAILFADDLAFRASTVDDPQRCIYNFHIVASKYNMEISTEKSKTMAFRGKETVPSKICLNKLIERTNNFTYLGYGIIPRRGRFNAKKIKNTPNLWVL